MATPHVMRQGNMRAPRGGYVTGQASARIGPAYGGGPAYGYGQPGYYDNDFNPVAGVLGAAAGIAAAPLAITTGGYSYGEGYYGAGPGYVGAPYGYDYGYYNSPTWPKRGPYYNTW